MKSLARFAALLFLFAWGCNEDTISPERTNHLSQINGKDTLLMGTPAFRSFFPCLEGINEKKASNRRATLRGADWELYSTIAPECLPERHLVFAANGQNPFLSRKIVTRTTIWVTKRNDQIYARVLQSGGAIEQQLIAIGFATNQKCTQLKSKNCRILLSPPPRID